MLQLVPILTVAIFLALTFYLIRQCRKPAGLAGRFFLSMMNRSHSDLTAWGLKHAQVGERDTILDVGCGGGRTVERLAAMASQGKVNGVDYAQASLDASRRLNTAGIESGRVQIQYASVSTLPFADDAMDLVTAVETHYYWPDRPGAMNELWRVLKPGGRLLMIAEAYRGGTFDWPYRMTLKLIGGSYLTVDEHRDLFVNAGYTDVQVFVEPRHGWICATGRKPLAGASLG